MPALPQTSASGSPAAPARQPSERARLRFFHSGAALVMLVLAFAGFHQFYLHGRAYPGREIAPPIRTLVVTHGATMTAWMLLLVVQPLLIAVRRPRVHISLGWVGVALAAVITVTGWNTGIASARVTPPEARIWGLPPDQFMIVPVASVVLFAAFVAAGVAARKRPEIHRAAMLLATLAALSAAVSRIDTFNALYTGTAAEAAFGPFLTTLVAGALLVAVKCAMARRLDPWLAGGYGVVVVANYAMWQLAPTEFWGGIAGWLLR